MKTPFGKSSAMAAGLLLAASPLMFGGVVLSENFENPAGLSDGNWARNVSGVIVPNPAVGAGNPSANVLEFTSAGSGGDLFSIFLPLANAEVNLSFDFYETVSGQNGSYAWAGTDHQNASPCGFGCDEQWLWNNNGGAIYGTNPPIDTWSHVSFTFNPFSGSPSVDSAHPGQIVVKFEGTPGNVFFDNIVVAAVPEPGVAGCLCVGLLAIAIRRRISRSGA